MKKILLTIIVAATCVMGMAQNYGFTLYTSEDYVGLRGLAMSPSGRYIAGVLGVTASAGTFIIDTETGEICICETGGEFRGVSDTGVAIGYGQGGAITCDMEGKVTSLVKGGSGIGNAITPDGTLCVGNVYRNYADGGSAWYTHACYWKDGETVLLPEPTAEELGFRTDGTSATAVSADGSLIVGFVIDNWATYPLIVWKLNEDGTYTCDPISKDYYEEDQWAANHPYYTFSPTAVSSNGRYIAMTLESSCYDNIERIGRYDMETGVLVEAANDNNFLPSGISDDGSILAALGGVASMNKQGYIWTPENDEAVTIRSIYPYATDFATYDAAGDHQPMSISPDGRFIMGFVGFYDEAVGQYKYGTYLFDTQEYENALSIDAVRADEQKGEEIYGIDGTRRVRMQHGINIIRKNGKTVKYMKK
ncbi:MAG: hypothetical protein LUC88_07350 [Prevotella sp.]|nr:hypothetical protein [Prevotella sp.]